MNDVKAYTAAQRKLKNRTFTAICIFSASVSVIVLAILLLSLGREGATHLVTRAPRVDELTRMNWRKLADDYAVERMAAAAELPEATREQVTVEIDRFAAGLSSLADVDWAPVVEAAGIEDIEDLEDIDWASLRAQQGLPETVELMAEIDGGDWEDLIARERIVDAGALGDFLSAPPSRKPERAGLGPAMWGSIWICSVCALLALPLGAGTAVFLEEYKPTSRFVRLLHGFLQLNISNLAGVPSIVYGIIGLTAFVQMFGLFGNLNDPILTLGTLEDWYYVQIPFGRGVLAGGCTLMLVILPIVIISSQEALRAVPNSLREGALAAGATKWQMVSRMTLPAAVPGIMTGAILAMSRAIGEAAPILVIAGIVFIRFTPQHLMDEFTAMPLQIFNWAGRPQEAFHRVAATGIIVLLAVLLTFNAGAVFIRQKFQKPLQ